MSDELADHLARDEALWRAWREEGVTERTPLAVDFNFYATSEGAAKSLAGALRREGFEKVEVRTTRTVWIFKGWTVWVVHHGTWSLDRLQDRTRAFYELGARHSCRLEGCGAMMPDGDNAEPGAAPNGGPAEPLGNLDVGGGPPSVS